MENREHGPEPTLQRPRRTRREWIRTSWLWWLAGVFVIGWSLYQYLAAPSPGKTDFLHGALIGSIASAAGLGVLLATGPRARTAVAGLLGAVGATGGAATGTVLVGASPHLRLTAIGAMGAVFSAGFLWSIGYMATHWSTLGWRSARDE